MSDVYESRTLLHQYLLFHYGSPEEILGGTTFAAPENEPFTFPVRTVTDTFDFMGCRI